MHLWIYFTLSIMYNSNWRQIIGRVDNQLGALAKIVFFSQASLCEFQGEFKVGMEDKSGGTNTEVAFWG